MQKLSLSSESSNLSIAEEATEDLIKSNDNCNFIGNLGKFDLTSLSGFTNCPESPTSFINVLDPRIESITYDPIKPDHIKIIDLHVDNDLKPRHLMSPKLSRSWIGDDHLLSEKRRQSIVQYLAPSHDTKKNSFDDNQGISDVQSMGNALWLMRSSNGEVDADELMANLDFQILQRNERSHFVLTELLIETIEFAFSDELLRRFSRGSANRTSTNGISAFLVERDSLQPLLLPSSINDEPGPPPCSSAEFMAQQMLDELQQMCPLVNVENKFSNSSASCFYQLKQRLERKREFSCSSRHDRSSNATEYNATGDGSIDQSNRHRYATSLNPIASPSLSLSSSSHVTTPKEQSANEKIKALVESTCYPLSIPVGQYCVLGPDDCLPVYVVTMAPIPTPSQSAMLDTQHHRCPSCHLTFSTDSIRHRRSRLRLCHYYGYYFCSVCHSNTLMLIPARILAQWDFTMLPVSCQARDLLKLIHSEPLFMMDHFSDKLRSGLPLLQLISRLRHQGRLLLDFVETCRQGVPLKRAAMKFPSHWLVNTVPKFSLADFQLMDSGVMENELRSFVSACVEHISICPLCQAHGFRCELCDNKSDVLFPFEMDKVHQCRQCRACSHISCYERVKSTPCIKCERRRMRSQQMLNSDVP